MAEEHDHDFRRVWASDLNPELAVGDASGRTGPVVAVCCHICGKSPLAVLAGRPSLRVREEWPAEKRITAFYNDDKEGPSVEYAVSAG